MNSGFKYVSMFVGLAIVIALGFIFLFVPVKRTVTVTDNGAYTRALPDTAYATTTLTMGGEDFVAQISDTPTLQELGLSYRMSIGAHDAMLFSFPQPAHYQFWMRDMSFSLDIIWVSSDKRILYIEKNLAPSTYPNSFGPAGNSQYVIEVASGTADRLGLDIGQTISF